MKAMPRTPPTDALSRWLAAERSGASEDAEAALAELLGELPRPAPPAGFAERVLARTRGVEGTLGATPAMPAVAPIPATPGITPAPGLTSTPAITPTPGITPMPAFEPAVPASSRRPWRRHRMEWRLAAGLGLAAAAAAKFSALWLPAAVRALVGVVSIAGLLPAGISSIFDLGHWVAAVVTLGNKLLLLDRAVAAPLATPPVAALAGGGLLVSVLALRFLYELIQRDRRWVYVDPI
jgi:hypothetical protein